MKNSLKKLLLCFCFQLSLGAFATTTYTVGAAGTYTTILAAYNACTTATDYVIEIRSDYALEALPIVLLQLTNKSSSNTVTIRPQSGVSKTLTTTNAQVFDFSGGDYITIDGKYTNGTGQLTLENTDAADYVIRFTNDATNNTIKRCIINGSGTSTTTGTIFFSDGIVGGTGNDNNTITYCTIQKSATGKPANAIYSAEATTATANGSNTVSYCSIIDFTNQGIFLSTDNDAWTISRNSMYQSSSQTPAASLYFINVTSGGGYSVRANYLGGQAANCGGSAFDIATSAFVTTVIRFTGVSGTACTIDSNVVSNITHISTNDGAAATAQFIGISIAGSCDFTVGSSGNGNTIGANTGTGSIILSPSGALATAPVFQGIKCIATGINTINYNTFGGITINNPTSNTTTSYIIYLSAGASNSTISYNTIGNTTAANITTANLIPVRLIQCSSSNNVNINNNTIQNLSITINATKYLIRVDGTGTYNISSNTIGSTVANNLSFPGGSSLYVIYPNGAAGVFTISSNTFQQINLTGSFNIIKVNAATTLTASSNTFKNITGTTGTSMLLEGNSVTGTLTFNSNIVQDITTLAYWSIWGSASGTTICNSNTIGSTTSNNMTFTGDLVSYGFYLPSTTSNTCNDNIIQGVNMTNTGSSTYFIGLYGISGNDYTFTRDTIRNINIAGSATSTINATSGIWVAAAASTTNLISQCAVQNITHSNTGNVATLLNGISVKGSGTGTIKKCHVSGLKNASTSTTAENIGIRIDNNGSWSIYNNVVLNNNGAGTGSPILRGISLTSSASGDQTIYHNSISIYGTTSSGSGIGTCFYKASTSGTAVVKNNVWQNVRSTGGGTQYACYVADATGLTVDYNYLENSGTNIASYVGSNQAAIGNWNGNATIGTDITGTITIETVYGASTGSSDTEI
jgi:hypothetical protein